MEIPLWMNSTGEAELGVQVHPPPAVVDDGTDILLAVMSTRTGTDMITRETWMIGGKTELSYLLGYSYVLFLTFRGF
jgi:hypothetical protein